MSAPMSIDKLIDRLRKPHRQIHRSTGRVVEKSSPAIQHEAADALAAAQEENRRLVKALDERDVLLESAEKQIVSLYRAATPGGNYDNELTINGHVSGNNFVDSDEVVIAIRGSRRANPDHGAAG